MIIIGIDPGLQKTGWGVIQSKGHVLQFIDCGLIKTKPSDSLALRLAGLHRELSHVIHSFKPDQAAVEETFVNKNPASALKLGQARGVVLAVPALFGLEVAEYSPNKIKKSVVGAGHADKQQIGAMVKMLLPGCTSAGGSGANNGGELGEDQADALAAAITHAHYGSVNSILSA